MDMNRKAYLRTIEVMIAILVTFLFVYYVFPKSQTPQESENLGILNVLEKSPDFRNCVIIPDYNCTESYLRSYMPKNYDFVFDISENPGVVRANLPEKNINTETVYIAGNISAYAPKIVSLYYWRIG